MRKKLPFQLFLCSLLLWFVAQPFSSCSPSPTQELQGEKPSTEPATDKQQDAGPADQKRSSDDTKPDAPYTPDQQTKEKPAFPESPQETPPEDTQCKLPSQVNEPGAVKTSKGWVKGYKEGNHWVYKGIPYASPPIAALRWRPPVSTTCWNDVRDTSQFGPVCPQLNTQTQQIHGDEDCLTLNIWRPEKATPTTPQAVMLFIHGGGNIQGSSSETLPGGKPTYNGKELAERAGVVVVTFNYRLGALGYLALPELSKESAQKVSGNYGIQDQIFAMKWVQSNIKAFGGDPSKVMLFGESAGSVNTCVHVASGLSKGLFHSALMQSGVCLGAPSLKSSEAKGTLIVEKTTCKGAADVLACLRKIKSEDLLKQMPGAINVGKLSGRDTLQEFSPIVDGWVLKKPPLETITANEHNNVPMVFGSNLEEMDNFLTTPIPTKEIYEAKVRGLLAGVAQADVDALLKEYDVNKYATPRAAMVDLMTDATFTCSTLQFAQAAAKAPGAKVWRYFFQRRAKTPKGETPARHGIELLYVFRTLTDIPLFQPAQEDLQLADLLIAYWSNLAKTGAPNDSKTAVKWTPYDPTKDNTLLLDSPVSMKEGVRLQRCKLWTKILTQLTP